MTIQALLKVDSIPIRSEMIALVKTGIQAKSLDSILTFSGLTDKELVDILPISKRQLNRYTPNHKLNKEITAHLLQIIELFQKGFRLFGEQKFKLWIRTHNKVLDAKPIDIMDTSIGIEFIEDVIGRIEHGVYS